MIEKAVQTDVVIVAWRLSVRRRHGVEWTWFMEESKLLKVVA